MSHSAVPTGGVNTPPHDQSGRCPSRDPYDGSLRCARPVHEDDRCQYGGIAWKKGGALVPSRQSLTEDIAELRATLARVEVLTERWLRRQTGSYAYALAFDDGMQHAAAELREALRTPTHDCASCRTCLHDGAKCCGCYDGACCKGATA